MAIPFTLASQRPLPGARCTRRLHLLHASRPAGGVSPTHTDVLAELLRQPFRQPGHRGYPIVQENSENTRGTRQARRQGWAAILTGSG